MATHVPESGWIRIAVVGLKNASETFLHMDTRFTVHGVDFRIAQHNAPYIATYYEGMTFAVINLTIV